MGNEGEHLKGTPSDSFVDAEHPEAHGWELRAGRPSAGGPVSASPELSFTPGVPQAVGLTRIPGELGNALGPTGPETKPIRTFPVGTREVPREATRNWRQSRPSPLCLRRGEGDTAGGRTSNEH